jgi:hypothetical protein
MIFFLLLIIKPTIMQHSAKQETSQQQTAFSNQHWQKGFIN